MSRAPTTDQATSPPVAPTASAAIGTVTTGTTADPSSGVGDGRTWPAGPAVVDGRHDTGSTPNPGQPAAAASRSRRGTPWSALAGVALLGMLVLAWEVAVVVSGVPEWIVPAPTAVGRAMVDNAATLAPAAMVTLGEAAAGLLIGSAIGLAAAVAITFVPRLERAILSVALLAKSTPIIAVAPILTIWFGFGHAPKVLVTALLTFFPMLVNALEGFRSVDPAITDWFHSVDAPRRAVFRHARWPTSWPYLFAALKVSAPLAMVAAVVAEWMGASSGLGRSMWLAYTNLRMPDLFAAVFVLTALSALVFQAVVVLERRAMAWRTPTPTT